MGKLASSHEKEPIEMRAVYCDSLIAAAKADSRIFALDCDLSSSMGTTRFHKELPEQAVNCGVQEANACGIAAGMSAVGFIPFVHSFAVFTSRRIYDQAFLSCAYAGLNVKLVGGDAGVSAGVNGGTHMAFEDVGIMRNIPGITIVDFSDTAMLAAVVPQVASQYGVFYMRMPRKNVHKVYERGSEFTLGKAEVLREGGDVAIIASGLCVYEALCAAELLAKDGVEARVVDMFTIKPIDRACVVESARRTGAVVTAENHNIINGLGSAVAEVLSEDCPVPLVRVGIQDEFGEVGPQDYLMKRFGITSQEIYRKAKEAIAKK